MKNNIASQTGQEQNQLMTKKTEETASKCSLITHKPRFFACLHLVSAASETFLNACQTRRNAWKTVIAPCFTALRLISCQLLQNCRLP
jgi:hypothetical protein